MNSIRKNKGERKRALEEADEMNGSSRLVTAIKSKYKRVTMATKVVHLNRMVMKVFEMLITMGGSLSFQSADSSPTTCTFMASQWNLF